MFSLGLLMSAALAGSFVSAPDANPAPMWPSRIVQIASTDPAYQGQCVAAMSQGAPLTLTRCNAADRGQQWQVLDQQNEFSRLRNVRTGLCALGPMGDIEEVTGATCYSDPDVLWRYISASHQIQRARVSGQDTPWCWRTQSDYVQAENCSYASDGPAQDWQLRAL